MKEKDNIQFYERSALCPQGGFVQEVLAQNEKPHLLIDKDVKISYIIADMINNNIRNHY